MSDSTVTKPDPPKRKLRIFLCHASEDKQQVREIYRRLRSAGFDVWFDEERLLPGQDWQSEIAKAVRASDVVLVFLSARSINKVGFVQKEIRFALDIADEQPHGAIFLIPIRLQDCPVPERLHHWQWVDYFEEKAYVRLVSSLRIRATELGVSMARQPFIPFPTGWYSVQLGGYRACEATYCFFPYESLPPLDESMFQGDFQWLIDPNHKTLNLPSIHDENATGQVGKQKQFIARVRELGLQLPPEFNILLRSAELRGRIPSVTSCFFDLSPKIVEYPVADLGFVIRFLTDQQGLLSWCLYLNRKGDNYVVVSPLWLDRQIRDGVSSNDMGASLKL